MVSSEIRFRKNRLFAKYGHECEMANELDELPRIIQGNSLYARLKRSFTRLRMVSEINKSGYRFFRSQGAIASENSRHLKKHFYIVHPFSDARQYWSNFICCIFIIQFILIPLDVAYFRIPIKTLYQQTSWKWMRMVCDTLCFVDCLFNFFTGYYDFETKQSILDQKEIAKHYLRTYFIPDFLSSMPTHIDLFMEIDLHTPTYLILQLTSLLKLLRLYTFLRYCNFLAENYEVPYAVYKTFLSSLISVLYFHWITCTLILAYAMTHGYFNLMRKEANNLYEESRYSQNLYKAVMLICNSGLGDTEKDKAHIIIMIIVWLFSKLLFVYFIAILMQVTKAITSASHKYIEMVHQLREYMRHRHLPEYMQRRLLTYYEFRFQKSYFRESEILSTVSGQLRQEIVMHSCRKLVENVAFFKNLPLTLLIRIVSCLRSEVFLINDVIVRANTPGNSMFFIASGTVAIYTNSGKEVCHLEDGAHFGEIALVMRDELRVASVVAVEVCELYRLDRKEFVRAIHPYPDLLDNIQKIAAERMETTTMLDEHNRREMATRRLY